MPMTVDHYRWIGRTIWFRGLIVAGIITGLAWWMNPTPNPIAPNLAPINKAIEDAKRNAEEREAFVKATLDQLNQEKAKSLRLESQVVTLKAKLKDPTEIPPNSPDESIQLRAEILKRDELIRVQDEQIRTKDEQIKLWEKTFSAQVTATEEIRKALALAETKNQIQADYHARMAREWRRESWKTGGKGLAVGALAAMLIKR